MNRQEIFDKAVGGIIKQGGPAARQDSDGTFMGCMYYVEDSGRRCAIGQLLTDEQQSLVEEGEGVISMLGDGSPDDEGEEHDYDRAGLMELLGQPNLADITFLDQLQGVHDVAARETRGDESFLHVFKQRVILFAARYELNAAVVANG